MATHTRLNPVGVEEAEEVALLGPNRRGHPAAELRGLGVPAPDVAADQMRGRHEAQGRLT
jgi:hypothetical protein